MLLIRIKETNLLPPHGALELYGRKVKVQSIFAYKERCCIYVFESKDLYKENGGGNAQIL